jgi:hypothetical protein
MLREHKDGFLKESKNDKHVQARASYFEPSSWYFNVENLLEYKIDRTFQGVVGNVIAEKQRFGFWSKTGMKKRKQRANSTKTEWRHKDTS